MTARKIDAMHFLYGIADGLCKDCKHLISGRYHDKILHKCTVYGCTHSEATDWRLKYTACGMKNLSFPDGETPVIDRIRYQKEPKDSKPIDGQITMEELLNETE